MSYITNFMTCILQHISLYLNTRKLYSNMLKVARTVAVTQIRLGGLPPDSDG